MSPASRCLCFAYLLLYKERGTGENVKAAPRKRCLLLHNKVSRLKPAIHFLFNTSECDSPDCSGTRQYDWTTTFFITAIRIIAATAFEVFPYVLVWAQRYKPFLQIPPRCVYLHLFALLTAGDPPLCKTWVISGLPSSPCSPFFFFVESVRKVGASCEPQIWL